jgi:hypothetical protein
MFGSPKAVLVCRCGVHVPAETEKREKQRRITGPQPRTRVGSRRQRSSTTKHCLQWRKGGEGGRGAHLESPPSLWKASGLEPSFMNFMVKTKGTLSSSSSPCLPPSLLSASQRQTPLLLQVSVFLASISRLLVPLPCASGSFVALFREQWKKETPRSSRKRDERAANRVVRWKEAGGIYYCSWFFTGAYLVHNQRIVHKCTNSTRAVHHEIRGRRKICKEDHPHRIPSAVPFSQNPPRTCLLPHECNMAIRTEQSRAAAAALQERASISCAAISSWMSRRRRSALVAEA